MLPQNMINLLIGNTCSNHGVVAEVDDRGRFAVGIPAHRPVVDLDIGHRPDFGLNILEAKIHTTRNGYALDTFLVINGNGGTYAGAHGQPALVERDLASALAADTPLREPVTGRLSRQARHFAFEPNVAIRPDERGQRYILSVIAGDRPGLLYRVALALNRHGVNLQTAKITTLGERAEDVFLIDGGKLANPKEALALETDLVESLRQ